MPSPILTHSAQRESSNATDSAHTQAHTCLHINTCTCTPSPCATGESDSLQRRQKITSPATHIAARSAAHSIASGRGQVVVIAVEGAWGVLRTRRRCCWVAWPGAKRTGEGVCSCFPGSAQQKLSILTFTSCYKLPRPKQSSKTVSLACLISWSPVRPEQEQGRGPALAQEGPPPPAL